MAIPAALSAVEEFSGDDPSYNVRDFLGAVDAAAKMANLQETEKCNFCRLKLRGSAREWLGTDPELPALKKWTDLEEQLETRFNPAADAASISQQIAMSKQKVGESVAQFATRLQRLGVRWNEARGLPSTSTERDARRAFINDSVLGQFLTGLDPRIKKYVQVQKPKDMKAAIAAAQSEEMDLVTANVSNIALVSAPRDRTGQPRRLRRCFNCQKFGSHIARECRARPVSPALSDYSESSCSENE